MKNISIQARPFYVHRILAVFLFCLFGVLYVHATAQAKPAAFYRPSAELGQYTYTVNYAQATSNNGAGNSAPGPLGLYSPYGTALDTVNHRLFVTDYGNNRVLVYALNSS